MFIIILGSILKDKNSIKHKTNASQKSFKQSRENLIIAISLAIVFGLGWGFGLVATSNPIEELTILFQILFSIFVGAQGVLLFILHGIRNAEIRNMWKGWCVFIVRGTRLSNVTTKNTSRTPDSATGINTLEHTSAAATGMNTLECTLPHKVDLSKQINLKTGGEENEVTQQTHEIESAISLDNASDMNVDLTDLVSNTIENDEATIVGSHS